MVAGFGSNKEVACLQDIYACAWGNGVEKLDGHRMHKLLSVLQSYLVEVPKFALDKEEKLVMQECRMVCKKKTAFAVVLISKRDIALSVLMINSFVLEEIFADNNNTAGSCVTWNLN